jgi:hypothetical protein
MQSMQLHLSGAARSWLRKVPNESIGMWEDLKDTKSMFGNLTQIYNSDRILGATDMGTPVKARGIGTLGLYSREAYEY